MRECASDLWTSLSHRLKLTTIVVVNRMFLALLPVIVFNCLTTWFGETFRRTDGELWFMKVVVA